MRYIGILNAERSDCNVEIEIFELSHPSKGRRTALCVLVADEDLTALIGGRSGLEAATRQPTRVVISESTIFH